MLLEKKMFYHILHTLFFSSHWNTNHMILIVFYLLKMTGVWQRYFLLMVLLVIAWSEAKDICWWWWFSWWLLQVRPRGQCLLPNLGRLRFKPIRLQSPVKLHFAQYQRKMLKIFWTHDFNTWKQEKEGKCLQIHWGIEALSLKFQPIAALVLIQWPFSGLCVPIVDPKVKEDRVEALQNFFQVFGSITFYHFIYADHSNFTQNLTH